MAQGPERARIWRLVTEPHAEWTAGTCPRIGPSQGLGRGAAGALGPAPDAGRRGARSANRQGAVRRPADGAGRAQALRPRRMRRRRGAIRSARPPRPAGCWCISGWLTASSPCPGPGSAGGRCARLPGRPVRAAFRRGDGRQPGRGGTRRQPPARHVRRRDQQGGVTSRNPVHEAGPELGCAIPSRRVAGVAISSMREGLLPLNQWALQFHDRSRCTTTGPSRRTSTGASG